MINLHESVGPGSNSRSLYQQSNSLLIALQCQSFWGSYFIQKDPESINSVFALFDCFGAIIYELLIAGLIDLVYQSGKMAFISGEQRKKAQILRGTETILGNGEYKKTKIERTEE